MLSDIKTLHILFESQHLISTHAIAILRYLFFKNLLYVSLVKNHVHFLFLIKTKNSFFPPSFIIYIKIIKIILSGKFKMYIQLHKFKSDIAYKTKHNTHIWNELLRFQSEQSSRRFKKIKNASFILTMACI